MFILDLYNYHMHCNFCDGIHEAEDYVIEAVKKGFKALGFSSHVPIPYENSWTMKEEHVDAYFAEIGRLKEKYKDAIEIYTGLEIDYIDGDSRNIFNKYEVDYIIGSVHIFTADSPEVHYSIDGNEADFNRTLHELFSGNIHEFVRAYYRQVVKMLREHRPDILGHLDVIKKNNRNGKYFSENTDWYRELIGEVLQEAALQGTIIEVNTGGMIRGYIEEPYPSGWILKECKKLHIPIQLNSDAHSSESIGSYFDYALEIIKSAGYSEQKVLTGGMWKNVKI